MHPPGADIVLVRYGEIGLKSDSVKRRMERLLRENIEASLRDLELDDPVECGQSRLYVRTAPDRVDAVTDAVCSVFGVVSASPAVCIDPTITAIEETLARTVESLVETEIIENTVQFAVRARRAGPKSSHPFSSTDIEREGGSAVWEALESSGVDPAVDLDDPELTIFVECRQERAFVFLEKQSGPGGLPVGSQEPLVALVSGGIDSPVAAWSVMKRGCPVYPLYIDLGIYGGVDHRARAVETTARLQSMAAGHTLTLRIAPGGDALTAIVESTDSLRMPVVRRFMLRVAEHVARDLDAVGIVTGESLGQKSSQTSASLAVTSEVTTLPIHRPLLCMDKTEITDRAREIGTYRDSTIDTGCNLLAPDQPATRPPLSTVENVEPDNVGELARKAAESVETVVLE